MSRIGLTFQALQARGERALIPYLTAGYPAPAETVSLLHALDRGGADIIELGVPFSDPIADGPTIQRASSAALQLGTTLKDVLRMVAQFREKSNTPLVLFGAYNPFFHYGLEKFLKDAAAAGADGALIPDLPAEEAEEVLPLFSEHNLDLIHLVAPTTPPARQKQICNQGTGFIYYISLKGVTGARASLQEDIDRSVAALKSCSSLPVAVGFGVSTPQHAATIGQTADGVVVGSALIDLITRHAGQASLLNQVEEFMRSMKNALPKMEKADTVQA
jgi:tryptophan synthase alpha chain